MLGIPTLNHFVKYKNTTNFVILFRTISRKIKMLRILFWTILQKRKILGILFLTIKWKKTFGNTQMTLTKKFFAEFRSVLFWTSEWSLPRHREFCKRRTFFHGISKTVATRNFFGTEVRWQPYSGSKGWQWNMNYTTSWIHKHIHM